MEFHQIDCFNLHLKFLKFFGLWPGDNPPKWYPFYSATYLFTVVGAFVVLFTINFYFLPRQLEIFAEDMTFYFMELTVLSKVLACIFMRDKIKKMLAMLESDIFQSNVPEHAKIINDAKHATVLYWKITTGISLVANSANVYTPIITHLIFSSDLVNPVCTYYFIPEEYQETFMYPVFFYQAVSITTHMWYNINVDTFFLGVMFLAIAQLDVLDKKLRNVCNNVDEGLVSKEHVEERAVMEINKCIIHYGEIYEFCRLIEDAFSETLFVQLALGSVRICVCLFRFTLPITLTYSVFLCSYMIIMILQIMVPCWFGSELIESSSRIKFSVYDCDWTPRSRRFKSNLRLLAERANRPFTITGGKMFLLSLGTFTAIMNSAYSFYTLLRHMQSRD